MAPASRSRLPVRMSTDKPLPPRPIATVTSGPNTAEMSRTLLDAGDIPLPEHQKFVALTPRAASMPPNNDSRPHSPSAASFSRVRRFSGLPIRARTASPMARVATPLSRTSSLLTHSPGSPDSYSVTDEELSGLRSVNRLSREGGIERSGEGRFLKARIVDIPPSKRNIDQSLLPSSPPSSSVHTAPLTTIHSQAAFPTFDFDDLQPATPSTPLNQLPPRSSSHTPLSPELQDAVNNLDDDDSHVDYGNPFEGFTGCPNTPVFNSDATEVGTSLGGGSLVRMREGFSRANSETGSVVVIRNDSPMQLFTGSEEAFINAEHDAIRAIVQKEESALNASQHQQGLAGRKEPVRFSNPLSSEPTYPHKSRYRYAGMAGVNTAGKERALREAMQKTEPKLGPHFARTTAASAAKNSAPPDIPREKNQREPAKKLKYPPLKSRGVLGKIGGLFKKNKAQSRSTMVKDIATPVRECTSPLPDDAPTVQLRLGYNNNDHRLSTKRQSLRAAMEVQRGPSPSPLISPIKSPAWQPSPLASSSPAAEKSKIPAPTFFGPRSVSPMSTRPDSPPIAADGSNETTEMLCNKLKNQARTETNERVKNKLLDIASYLHKSLVNAREAANWAAHAMRAADEAATCTQLNEKFLQVMQKRAARAIQGSRK